MTVVERQVGGKVYHSAKCYLERLVSFQEHESSVQHREAVLKCTSLNREVPVHTLLNENTSKKRLAKDWP